jgi:hypothetical protein
MRERPRTPEEYVELVDQALLEVEHMRMSSEYDMESLGSDSRCLDALYSELQKLRASMADGDYRFGRADLPFMRLMKRCGAGEIPCRDLLYTINLTHREGLDAGGE